MHSRRDGYSTASAHTAARLCARRGGAAPNATLRLCRRGRRSGHRRRNRRHSCAQFGSMQSADRRAHRRPAQLMGAGDDRPERPQRRHDPAAAPRRRNGRRRGCRDLRPRAHDRRVRREAHADPWHVLPGELGSKRRLRRRLPGAARGRPARRPQLRGRVSWAVLQLCGRGRAHRLPRTTHRGHLHAGVAQGRADAVAPAAASEAGEPALQGYCPVSLGRGPKGVDYDSRVASLRRAPRRSRSSTRASPTSASTRGAAPNSSSGRGSTASRPTRCSPSCRPVRSS